MDIFSNISRYRKTRDKNIDSKDYKQALNYCKLLMTHCSNKLTFDDWFKAGLCNFRLDDNYEAIHCYSNALDIDPTNSHALAYKALCLLRLDPINEAFQLLRSALSINPNIGSAWFSIGNYYMERRDQVEGSYEKGINAFRRAVKLIPETINAKVFIPALEEYGSVGYLLDFTDNIPDLNDQEIR
jgi:tetratricopeptide (TPR) repeat protein